MNHELEKTDEKAAKGTQRNGAREADAPTQVLKLSMDQHESIDSFAAARAKGAVVSVSFDGEEPAGESCKQAAELSNYLEHEHLFITRYDEVLATLVDPRFSSDVRNVIT